MASPNEPEYKNFQDDVQLKKEIDAISTRIDRIMETIKPHFPVNQDKPGGIEASDDN